MTPLLTWVKSKKDLSEWNLMLTLPGRKKGRCVATVWEGYGTWHTWDRNGVGGWNSVEDPEPFYLVKEIAAGAAILQGFI